MLEYKVAKIIVFKIVTIVFWQLFVSKFFGQGIGLEGGPMSGNLNEL